MLLKLKSLAEASLGKHIHIDRSAPVDGIKDLMATLRPQAIRTSLIRVGELHDGGYLVPNDGPW